MEQDTFNFNEEFPHKVFDDDPPPPTDLDALSRGELKFLEYHNRNPEVYALFKEYAFTFLRSGQEKIGARVLIDLIRWGHVVNRERPPCEYKIPNHHIAHYARLFIKDHPEHEDFFETRELKI